MSEKRCRRCNTPHYKHPDASSAGGVGRLLEWRQGFCPVCRALFSERLGE